MGIGLTTISYKCFMYTCTCICECSVFTLAPNKLLILLFMYTYNCSPKFVEREWFLDRPRLSASCKVLHSGQPQYLRLVWTPKISDDLFDHFYDCLILTVPFNGAVTVNLLTLCILLLSTGRPVGRISTMGLTLSHYGLHV